MNSYFYNSYIVSEDINYPNKANIKRESLLVSSEFACNKLFVTYKNSAVKQDKGFMFSDQSNEDNIKISNYVPDQVPTTRDFLGYNIIYNVEIDADHFRTVTYVKYTKIQEAIASLGGIISIFKLVLGFSLTIINKFNFSFSIFREVFLNNTPGIYLDNSNIKKIDMDNNHKHSFIKNKVHENFLKLNNYDNVNLKSSDIINSSSKQILKTSNFRLFSDNNINNNFKFNNTNNKENKIEEELDSSDNIKVKYSWISKTNNVGKYCNDVFLRSNQEKGCFKLKVDESALNPLNYQKSTKIKYPINVISDDNLIKKSPRNNHMLESNNDLIKMEFLNQNDITYSNTNSNSNKNEKINKMKNHENPAINFNLSNNNLKNYNISHKILYDKNRGDYNHLVDRNFFEKITEQPSINTNTEYIKQISKEISNNSITFKNDAKKKLHHQDILELIVDKENNKLNKDRKENKKNKNYNKKINNFKKNPLVTPKNSLPLNKTTPKMQNHINISNKMNFSLLKNTKFEEKSFDDENLRKIINFAELTPHSNVRSHVRVNENKKIENESTIFPNLKNKIQFLNSNSKGSFTNILDKIERKSNRSLKNKNNKLCNFNIYNARHNSYEMKNSSHFNRTFLNLNFFNWIIGSCCKWKKILEPFKLIMEKIDREMEIKSYLRVKEDFIILKELLFDSKDLDLFSKALDFRDILNTVKEENINMEGIAGYIKRSFGNRNDEFKPAFLISRKKEYRDFDKKFNSYKNFLNKR